MEMIDMLGFHVCDDHIKAMNRSFYIFRIIPPNFTTLDEHEKQKYRQGFENVMRASEEFNFNLFSMDKTTNLDANKTFISSFSDQFDYIKEGLLRSISDTENISSNSERSHYFIVSSENRSIVKEVEQALESNFVSFLLCKEDELITIMRCFLLREFIDQPIYQEGE